MMCIPFNQKQEGIWSTWGHQLPSGPWRKSQWCQWELCTRIVGHGVVSWCPCALACHCRNWLGKAVTKLWSSPRGARAFCWLLYSTSLTFPDVNVHCYWKRKKEKKKPKNGVLCSFPVPDFGRTGILWGLNCTAPMASLLASVSGDTMSADSTVNLQGSSSSLLEWSGDYYTGKYFAELAGLGLELLILWQRRTSHWGAVNLIFCWC